MQGIVKYLNADDATAAIETSPGRFTIVGVMADDALGVGDEISGDLDGDGAVSLSNDTRGTSFDAYIEDNEASEDLARQSGS